MTIIGLTGSLAMGKSTAASMLHDLGWFVHDADETVHRLYQKGGAAVAVLAELMPQAIYNGAINRSRLTILLREQPDLLPKLEKTVHRLVSHDRQAWVKRCRRQGISRLVFEVPLLFETSLDKHCDAVFLVSAPRFVQRHRALQRKEMNPQKLEFLLNRQMPEVQKRRRADFIIPSGAGKARMWNSLATAVVQL